jgi:nucleotide-binding universal stress UspA family protein
VATDFSPAARAAVWRAGQLAQQNDAHLHLVHAQPDWNLFSKAAPAGPENYRVVGEHAESALADELRNLESVFGIHVRGETRMGRASEVLHSATAEVSPHLIVVGARGEHDSPSMAPFLGGTAFKLIAFSAAPVLVVRQAGSGPYVVSMAAVEGPSASALTLVSWARALAPAGECHLVHAFDVPYVARLRQRGVSETDLRACEQEVRASATNFVNEVMSSYGESKHRLHAHLVCGEPVGAVLAELERCKPDVAVVGKHERPPRDQRLRSLGSIALRIAYHAACDVLVVP